MIRILLVDDQNILRQGIQALLEPRPKLQVVGTAEDGNSAIEQVGTLMPDIVLMDIEMPVMNGIIATQKICQQFPKTKVLVLSSHEDRESVIQAIQVGAKGYLLKNTLAEDLEQAIWSVYRGRSQIESKLLKEVFIETATPFSQLITQTEQNGSTSVERRSPQEISSKLHNNSNKAFDTNDKHLLKDREDTEISSNGSPSTNSKTNLNPVLERFKIEKPPDLIGEALDVEESSSERVTKDPFVRQDSAKPEQKRQFKKTSLKASQMVD
ncbi:MAG: response regulator transcription factor [Pleurocapsa sp. CRU_1_2]|nr:response regulator transcription factor [Pleurocapsa sp. CRU_1_2]